VAIVVVVIDDPPQAAVVGIRRLNDPGSTLAMAPESGRRSCDARCARRCVCRAAGGVGGAGPYSHRHSLWGARDWPTVPRHCSHAGRECDIVRPTSCSGRVGVSAPLAGSTCSWAIGQVGTERPAWAPAAPRGMCRSRSADRESSRLKDSASWMASTNPRDGDRLSRNARSRRKRLGHRVRRGSRRCSEPSICPNCATRSPRVRC
jgi:hypothetical protein